MTVQQARLRRLIDQLTEAESSDGDAILSFDRGAMLHVSNLAKPFFGRGGPTKGDLMRYYTWVSPYILPLMKDRALALKRFPNGVGGKFFFQQKAPPDVPKPVRVETIISEAGEPQERLIGGSLATLLYCVQLGAIEVNPWNARVQSLEHPDFTVIDLDPGPKAPFSFVVQAALWVKEQLDAHGLVGAAKTSGSTGIHIFLPLPPRTEENVAERVAQRIAAAVTEAHPRETTLERSIKLRGASQIYVDAGQNARGKTVASAYSVRAKPGAPVSTPLAWDELTPELDPTTFNLESVRERVTALGDIWGTAMKKSNPRGAVTKT